MSRSFKKPYHGIAGCKRRFHRFAKNQMQRETRRILDVDEDACGGSYYKKFLHSWRWRPDDGKIYNPDCKKAYRK